MTDQEREFEQWRPLIRYWLRRCRVSNDEDAAQIAAIALWQAIQTYNPRIAARQTHYSARIRYALAEYIRTTRKSRMKKPPVFYHFDFTEADGEDNMAVILNEPHVDSFEDTVCEKVDAQRMLEALPPRLRQAVWLYAEHGTLKAAGTLLNVSESRVYQLVKEARRIARGMTSG